ncbi:MAG: DUF3750 domain-containing protein [Candidatus Kaiserbacteria bacterium]|nr:DUF3750 domain-containing protein [Candidatus Kaiserbacteria bacterium]
MKEQEFKSLLKPDRIQVFLFTSLATFPFTFARHPWFVINRKGTVSRWEIFWEASKKGKISWGHLHKNCYAPWVGIEMFFYTDRYLFDSHLEGVVEGDDGSHANRIADFIESSPERYGNCQKYSLLGPNSISYAEWILDSFPTSSLTLPWNSTLLFKLQKMMGRTGFEAIPTV